jgi:hypothetical protein
MPTFSGKMKKAQLIAKRIRKRTERSIYDGAAANGEIGASTASSDGKRGPSRSVAGLPAGLVASLGQSASGAVNRLSTVFAKEDTVAVRARRDMAPRPLDFSLRALPLLARERGPVDGVLDFPKGLLATLGGERGAAGIDAYAAAGARAGEEAAFGVWLKNIYDAYPRDVLSAFEHNLDVWMQLWHTLATADVICLISDARNPLWHIPPSLYEHVTGTLGKRLIIVLNKADLVPAHALVAWTTYLRESLPAATVVPFSASGAELGGAVGGAAGLAARRRALRAARGTFDEAHVTRREKCARDLLSAIGASDEAIDVVANRISATCKMSAHRADATLSTDRPEGTQVRDSAVTETSDDDDNELSSCGDDRCDQGGSSIEESVNDGDATSDDEAGSEDDGGGGGSADEENVPVASSSESDDETQFVLAPLRGRAARTLGRAISQRSQIADGGGGSSGGGGGSDINVSRSGVNRGIRGGIDDSDEGDGLDRFRGRPRHFKRGDAGRVAEAIAAGFKLGSTALASAAQQTSQPSEPIAAAEKVVAEGDCPPLIVGLVGHPNVGKSSVINALCSEKRVSVSRTAGHTKRAQTIPLAPGVTLLDCPGLVFPHALAPRSGKGLDSRSYAVPHGFESRLALRLSGTDAEERAMQECCGVVPLAQVREPFTAVRFLGEHLPLERLYGLTPDRDELEDAAAAIVSGTMPDAARGPALAAAAATYAWSPHSLCEALAVKRGILIAKTGQPDAHAAGRAILYDAQDGVLPLYWLPPNDRRAHADAEKLHSHAAGGGDDCESCKLLGSVGASPGISAFRAKLFATQT